MSSTVRKYAVIIVSALILYFIYSFFTSTPSKTTNSTIDDRRPRVFLTGNYHMWDTTTHYIVPNLKDEEKKYLELDINRGYALAEIRGIIEAKGGRSYWSNRMVVVEAGLNDLHELELSWAWRNLMGEFEKLVHFLQESQATIVVWAIIPWESGVEKAKEFNEQLGKFCRDHGVPFVKDTPSHKWQIGGFWLVSESYEYWGNITLTLMRQFWSGVNPIYLLDE